VDTSANFQHCNGCGLPCAGGEACDGSQCSDPNGCGLDLCADDSICVDFATDPLNCGGCGNVCTVDEVCVDGNCRFFLDSRGCAQCPCGACNGLGFRCCNYPGDGTIICVDAGGCP
jgi:hypothetical protein